MPSLFNIADPVPTVDPRTPGAVVYDRFAGESETFAIAVVDDENRPVGLVERNAFSLKMASEYGRALYARRPISLMMKDNPLVVEARTHISDFNDHTLATRADDVTKGFIIVNDGRYMGLANSLSLLQATSAASRRQADAMTEMASSFRLLFDHNPIAMWVVDIETTSIAAANEAALVQYGATLAELIGRPMRDLTAAGEHERFREARHKFKDRAYDGEDAWRHVRLDGSELLVEPFVRPMTHNGRPSSLCALINVTKRKQTEAQISQTRAFLDTVVESIPQTLLVRDAATQELMLINRAGEALLGVARDDVLGTTDGRLAPLERDLYRARRDAAFASGELDTAEEIIVTPAHGERILEIKRIAVPNVGGGGAFLLSICEDITERKRDAGALRHARDAAEASNRAKSEFLANMSHEIRTPLNGVVGVADALARTRLDAAQTEMVQIVQSSATALDRLLSDVLDLARVESGRLSITPEPLDLGELVHQAAALFRPGAHAKGLRFDVAITPQAQARVQGDGVRIKQVLFNLLSNAIKFTAQGGVALDVRTDADGAFIFAVTDSGVGFAQTAKNAVFGRFQQADGSITRRYGGSGLGLAISRDLAELMGGTLEAQSEPGQGCVFTLTLPLPHAATLTDSLADGLAVGLADGLAKDLAPSDGASADDDEAGDAAQTHTSPAALKVLLADDHPTNRKVVQLLLSTADVNIVSVENGQEALDAFKTGVFDIVLMDLQMPVMDGLTAIALIRDWERSHGERSHGERRDGERSHGGHTPVLALTANALPEHVAASRAAGADGHLAKPITAAALFAGIEAALDAVDAVEAHPVEHAA